jgi:hypothetical protein
VSVRACGHRARLLPVLWEPLAPTLRSQLRILDLMLQGESPNLGGAVAMLESVIDSLLRADPPGFGAAMQLLARVRARVESAAPRWD